MKILRKAAAAVEAVVSPKDRCRLAARLRAKGVRTGRPCLATNALGMAIDSGTPLPGASSMVITAPRSTSWTFTERACKAGLLPSLGTIGDPYHNAIAESF